MQYLLLVEVLEYEYSYIVDVFKTYEDACNDGKYFADNTFCLSQKETIAFVEKEHFFKKIDMPVYPMSIKHKKSFTSCILTSYIIEFDSREFLSNVFYEIYHTKRNIPKEYFVKTADTNSIYHICLSVWFISAS